MELKGKQVRYLRSLAHHSEPQLIVGQAGIKPTTIDQLNQSLYKHELVKVDIADSSGLDAREAGNELADKSDSALVQVIGHKVVFYKRSDKEGIEHIELP